MRRKLTVIRRYIGVKYVIYEVVESRINWLYRHDILRKSLQNVVRLKIRECEKQFYELPYFTFLPCLIEISRYKDHGSSLCVSSRSASSNICSFLHVLVHNFIIAYIIFLV